eukprot:TRINITY_DN2236_c0_g1_i5.p1 TRINITY_DN2236_c0_g1~~TRINITY_DN2236_c0_g1_i5.p1  ORF type:complete len:410 (-),score=134.15 TRINITY_DN2236_c0_g1_i5:115-1344(-)
MWMFFFFFFKQKTAYEMLRSLVGSEMCIRDRYQRRVRGDCLVCNVRLKGFGDMPEENWRFEASHGAATKQKRMDNILSKAWFEDTCERLLEQCLFYLPEDLSPFLVEALNRQIAASRPLCPPHEHQDRLVAWLEKSPIRTVFILLGERFAAAESSSGDLKSFMVQELADPELMETATKVHREKECARPGWVLPTRYDRPPPYEVPLDHQAPVVSVDGASEMRSQISANVAARAAAAEQADADHAMRDKIQERVQERALEVEEQGELVRQQIRSNVAKRAMEHSVGDPVAAAEASRAAEVNVDGASEMRSQISANVAARAAAAEQADADHAMRDKIQERVQERALEVEEQGELVRQQIRSNVAKRAMEHSVGDPVAAAEASRAAEAPAAGADDELTSKVSVVRPVATDPS